MGRLVVHGRHRPILVVYDRGRIFALDNRCPRKGFPLAAAPSIFLFYTGIEMAGNSKSGRKKGGTKTGGRKKGSLNKITVVMRGMRGTFAETAQDFAADALATLVKIMNDEAAPRR